MPCKRDQPQCDAVTIRHAFLALRLGDGHAQALAKILGLGAHDFFGQIVILRGARNPFAHRLQRHCDNLFGEGQIQRGELVEVQLGDHHPQGRALHQQGEQGEARRQNPDGTLGFRIDRVILGDRQGQRQRHRAAQPAPQDRRLIGRLHPRRETHERQRWQQQEQHNRARSEGGNRNHTDIDDVDRLCRGHQLGDQDRRENEDQRACPMREDIPKLAQLCPPHRVNPARGAEGQHQPADHHRDHARCAHRALSYDIGQIGDRHRNADLREGETVQPDEDLEADPRHHHADARAARHQIGELPERIARIGIGARHHIADDQPENRDRGGVVQKAFALDDPAQPFGRGE